MFLAKRKEYGRQERSSYGRGQEHAPHNDTSYSKMIESS